MNAIWDERRVDEADAFRLLRLLAGSHGVISAAHLRAAGVSLGTRRSWLTSGRLLPLGVRTFALADSAPGWRRSLAAAVFETRGVVSGRSAARLHGVFGFHHDDIEILVPRRCIVPGAVVSAPRKRLRPTDLTAIDGIAVVTLERLADDASLFHFTDTEHRRLATHRASAAA